MASNYYERGDRLNVYLADELPEDMTGTQDTQHICGKCAWYSFAKLESICRKTGKEVAYFANRKCFTTDKDMDMEENNNAQPVAESTGTQVCKECGRTLPLEDFQRRRNGNVDNVCKACRAEKARIGIARKKAAKVEFPEKIVKAVNAPSQVINELLEDAVKTEGEEIAELSRYLLDFEIAGLALWGKMPGKEEDIDNMIEAEWTVPFCQEIFAAAADLRRNSATKIIVPSAVSIRLGSGSIGEKFIDALGDAFYGLAKKCDTEEQMPAKWSEEDKKNLKQCIEIVGCWEIDYDYANSHYSNWLKSLPERFNLQPKEEWSEVELEFRGEKVKVKRPFFRDDKGRGYSTTEQDEEVAWNALRAWCEKKGISLYDLYPKVEWSEEDEDNLKRVVRIVEENDSDWAELTNWLSRSIRPGLYGISAMKQPARVPDISDAALLDELRRRGYKGRVSKCEEVEL